MKIQQLAIGMTALAAFVLAAIQTQAQTDVAWLPAGTSNYNTASNWEDYGFGHNVPDATANERGVINNGGTAFLTNTSSPAAGGLVLGQGPNDSGTLEIRNGGTLNTQVGPMGAPIPVDGNVIVGISGTGTLSVASGGTLNATALISGGSTASSIVLGDSSGSPANVNVSGVISLSKNTRIGRTAVINAGQFSLQPDSSYVVEVTASGHSIPTVTGTTTLDGQLTAEFSGVSPTLGSTYNLFETGALVGQFDRIQSAPNTLSLGQKWFVSSFPAPGGRQFAQLKLDEALVLNVNRGTGAVSITNPGTQSKSFDAYSILSASGSLLPESWNSLDSENALGGDWGEANPNVNRLSELKQAGFSTLTSGASRTLGIANSFNPSSFGIDSDDLTFEYTKNDGTLVNGIVNYIGDPNNLLLTVDPTTGEAQLKNTSPFTVSIDSYSIRSASGSLLTSSWNSLDDRNAAGGDWGEANPTANRLTELKAAGATTLTPNFTFSLGDLFNTNGAQDLQFEFLFAGENVARAGVVTYGTISAGLAGDFDNDGDVDGRDFLVWQRGGTTPPLDAGLLSQWQSNYGAPLVATVGAVPEPATWALCLAACLPFAFRRRTVSPQ